jgi:uncharacterized membrane protein
MNFIIFNVRMKILLFSALLIYCRENFASFYILIIVKICFGYE